MMDDTPAKRLAHALRERRILAERLRQGAITRGEYATTFRRLLEEARLQEPNLARPWWADDLRWLMRALAQAVHSRTLHEGEHVMFLQREARRFRRSSLDECRCLAIRLESSLPTLQAHGFGLSHPEVEQVLALAATIPEIVVSPRVRAFFPVPRRRLHVVVLDWAQVQNLGLDPRRGDLQGW